MHKLRKIIQKSGFDLHRYHPKAEKIEYIKNLNISTVLDVGANTGQFAREVRMILPDAFIYSFEPLSGCFEELNKNMAGDKKFKAFNIALGEVNEEKTMEKNEYSPSSSILPLADEHKSLFPHARHVTKEKITVKKLDDIASKLDMKKDILIKVDVQGYEDKVIAGGQSTFSKAKAVLIETSFVELYTGQPLFDDIYEQMKRLGFSYRGAVEEKIEKMRGEVISQDSLFVK